MKITHSPKDFLMLPDPADQKIAHSLIEKCGLWVLLAMTQADLDALSAIRKLEDTEASWVTGFMSGTQGLEQQMQFKDAGGRLHKDNKRALPGAGKALWKVGDSLGIPVQSPKPVTLGQLHDTDTRFAKN
jgi:putative ATP/GTP-binding protein